MQLKLICFDHIVLLSLATAAVGFSGSRPRTSQEVEKALSISFSISTQNLGATATSHAQPAEGAHYRLPHVNRLRCARTHLWPHPAFPHLPHAEQTKPWLETGQPRVHSQFHEQYASER